MKPKLTAAGRRALLAADPGTGLLRAAGQVLDGLVGARLAVRHPRPPHRGYLTAAGRELRAALLAGEPGQDESEPAAGVFAARTGAGSPPADPAARAREVRSAWQGLLELRRMTNKDGAVRLPCPWERTHLIEAVALALEAAELEGYLVTSAAAQPDAVRVDWRGESGLRGLVRCAGVLEEAGWQLSEHPTRGGGAYLLASPRRV